MNAKASFSADSACGARSAAMGGAFTAVSGGAEAICSNPATLLELSSPELTAAYGRLFSGLTDDSKIGQGYFGFAAPVKRYLPGAAAFAWNDTRLSEAYSETSYSVSYATTVYRGIGAGLTLKYLRRSYVSDAYTALDPVFANGYAKGALGADLGFFYRPQANYAFGLSLKNINKPDMGLASADRLPVEVRAGASYLMRASLLDIDAAFAGPDYTISTGLEYSFQKRYALRMGLAAGNNSRRNVNIGFGGRFGLAAFDYAFSLPIGGIANTNGSHRLAFSFRFGNEADLLRAEELAAAAELKRAQEKTFLQEEKIRVLQERLDGVVRQQGAVPAQQPVQVIQLAPAPAQPALQAQPDSAAQAEIARQLDVLKAELEKSRAEMEAMKARAAAKPAPQPKPAQAAAPHSYVVKEGDTLESIAASVYGNASRWPEIYRANSGSLGRGGEVKPGQVLTLP
ncbi:MAG: LysM peptidoglycan-binding domain-containing protein [Elusimicrobiales bacterium]|nr:LysM peptidoglycan-binding domain-containing protein [Elusimicrobiales bacterium]